MMPELPEVETVRRVLEKQIVNHRIYEVTVKQNSTIAHPEPSILASSLKNQMISSLSRRGKFLIMETAEGKKLIIHLRMTGCLLVMAEDGEEERHTHIVFHLSEGIKLCFSDQRRFGRMWLLDAHEEDRYSGISSLGLEPLSNEMTGDYLEKHMGHSRRALKECLMDQHVLAGIGNIYADEILFRAGILPYRPACNLSTEDWGKLAAAISERLAFFIEKNAISPEEYLLSRGKDYKNTPYLEVYGHKGEPCPVCGTLLEKTVIGGRSSVCCPHCQR